MVHPKVEWMHHQTNPRPIRNGGVHLHQLREETRLPNLPEEIVPKAAEAEVVGLAQEGEAEVTDL